MPRPHSRRMDPWGTAFEAFKKELLAAGTSSGTIKIRKSHLDRWARVCPRPEAATYDALVAWMAHPGWSPEYRRSQRSTLRTFYGWMYRTGRTTHDPAAALPAVRVPPPNPRPAAEAVILRALRNASTRVQLMILLGRIAGLRRAEITMVHCRDLDPSGRLTVQGKGGRSRTIQLPAHLASLVRAQACETGWLFPGLAGRPLSADYVGKLIARALPAGVTAHQLRHAAATFLHDQGLSHFEIRDFLGHASVATTQLYVHVRPTRTTAALEAAWAAMTPAA